MLTSPASLLSSVLHLLSWGRTNQQPEQASDFEGRLAPT